MTASLNFVELIDKCSIALLWRQSRTWALRFVIKWMVFRNFTLLSNWHSVSIFLYFTLEPLCQFGWINFWTNDFMAFFKFTLSHYHPRNDDDVCFWIKNEALHCHRRSSKCSKLYKFCHLTSAIVIFEVEVGENYLSFVYVFVISYMETSNAEKFCFCLPAVALLENLPPWLSWLKWRKLWNWQEVS